MYSVEAGVQKPSAVDMISAAKHVVNAVDLRGSAIPPSRDVVAYAPETLSPDPMSQLGHITARDNQTMFGPDDKAMQFWKDDIDVFLPDNPLAKKLLYGGAFGLSPDSFFSKDTMKLKDGGKGGALPDTQAGMDSAVSGAGSDSAASAIHASITPVTAAPSLRGGDTIDLIGVGPKFSGTYTVKRHRLTVDSGGVSSSIEAERNATEGGGAGGAGGVGGAGDPAAKPQPLPSDTTLKDFAPTIGNTNGAVAAMQSIGAANVIAVISLFGDAINRGSPFHLQQ